MLFEAALGISAGLLMRMQLDYNMRQTTSDKSFMERLNQVRKYAALLYTYVQDKRSKIYSMKDLMNL